MRQLLKNVTLVNGEKRDIVIQDGIIVEITEDYQGSGDIIQTPLDCYVSPGWIDLHTHAFPKYPPYRAMPDEIGIQTGVTTVVDAGTCGADCIDEFYQLAENSKTRVLAFLNISRIGLKEINELSNLDNISLEAIEKTVKEYPNFVIGLKARMSASVVESSGIEPLRMAKIVSETTGLPLMVHIGSAPPKIEDILPLLDRGDIVTHCFNGKSNNMFDSDGLPIPELQTAIERGVALDIGHGTASFSFDVAKQAREAHIQFDTISTDIYNGNKENGPVFDMATTLSKFLALGYSLPDIIRAVTEKPAKLIHRNDLGQMKPGAVADFTLFRIVEEEKTFIDSSGKTLTFPIHLQVKAVIRGGEYFELG